MSNSHLGRLGCAAALAMSIASCNLVQGPQDGGGADDFVALSFPDVEPTSGRIPFALGGGFRVHMRAEVPNLRGTIVAELDVLQSALPDATAGNTARATLRELGTPGVFEGDAVLAWPPGGAVSVRARAAGHVSIANVPLDAAELLMTQSPLGRGRYQICIASSVRDASISLALENATLADGSSSRLIVPVALLPTACSATSPTLATAVPQAFAAVTVSSPGAFRVTAMVPTTSAHDVLVGEPVTAGPTTIMVTRGMLQGTLLPVSAVVSDGTTGIAGVAVTFTSVPEVEFSPQAPVTDDTGTATAYFLIPPMLPAIHVDASALGERGGATFALP